MNRFIPNEVHIFIVVGFMLASTILMVFHLAYIQVKAKPSYFIKKYIHAHILLLLWLVVMLLQYIVFDINVSIRLSYIKEAMIGFVGYNIFLFAYSYSYKKVISKKVAILSSIIPMIALILLIGASGGGYSDLSLKLRYTYGTIVITYFLFGLTVFIYNLKKEGFNRIKESVYFMVAIGFDLFAHVIYYLGIINCKNDTLIFFLFLYLIILIGITIKYQMHDKIPFVLESILNNANYGILVITNKLEVVDYNKDFFKQYISVDVGNKFEDIINQFKLISDNKLSVDNILYAIKAVEQSHITGELRINLKEKNSHLFYTVSSIYDDRKQKIAIMITFRDMTEMIHLQNGIINKNKQLIKANKKLEEHMENMKELTVEKERDALMTEINDTFGHSMTEILALLEVSGLLLEQDESDDVIEVAISESTSRARAALEEMRQSVSKYKKGVGLND